MKQNQTLKSLHALGETPGTFVYATLSGLKTIRTPTIICKKFIAPVISEVRKMLKKQTKRKTLSTYKPGKYFQKNLGEGYYKSPTTLEVERFFNKIRKIQKSGIAAVKSLQNSLK